MPSKRPQLNVRLTDENRALLEQLRERMRIALNIDVSQADVISAALNHLAETKYPAAPAQKNPRKAPPTPRQETEP